MKIAARSHPQRIEAISAINMAARSAGGGGAAQPDAAALYAERMENYKLLLEYKQLRLDPQIGLYVCPATGDIRTWFGVLFCRTGPYAQGVFKFRVDLHGYPTRAPRIVFVTEVFNPLVDPKTGELDMSVQFPVWDPSIHWVGLALVYIKGIFYSAQYWDARAKHEPFNKEAARLWAHNRAKFQEMCDKCVRQSVQRVLQNPPGSSVRFSPPRHSHMLLQSRIITALQERADPSFSYLEWFSDGVRNLACNASQEQAPAAQAEENMIREVERRNSAPNTPVSASRSGSADAESGNDAGDEDAGGRRTGAAGPQESVPFPNLDDEVEAGAGPSATPPLDSAQDADERLDIPPLPSPMAAADDRPIGDGGGGGGGDDADDEPNALPDITAEEMERPQMPDEPSNE